MLPPDFRWTSLGTIFVSWVDQITGTVSEIGVVCKEEGRMAIDKIADRCPWNGSLKVNFLWLRANLPILVCLHWVYVDWFLLKMVHLYPKCLVTDTSLPCLVSAYSGIYHVPWYIFKASFSMGQKLPLASCPCSSFSLSLGVSWLSVGWLWNIIAAESEGKQWSIRTPFWESVRLAWLFGNLHLHQSIANKYITEVVA